MNRKKKTTWYNVSVWGKRAEACNNMLRKGSVVWVQGSVSARAYMSNGEPRSSLELRCQNIEFVENWGNSAKNQNSGPPSYPAAPQSSDDIPF